MNVCVNVGQVEWSVDYKKYNIKAVNLPFEHKKVEIKQSTSVKYPLLFFESQPLILAG